MKPWDAVLDVSTFSKYELNFPKGSMNEFENSGTLFFFLIVLELKRFSAAPINQYL